MNNKESILIEDFKSNSLEEVMINLEKGKYSEIENHLEQILIAVTIANKLQLINKLIQKGANINYDEQEALIFSIENNRIEAVKCLIAKGFDTSYNGGYSMSTAIMHDNVEIVDLFYKKEHQQYDLEKLTSIALRINSIEVLNYLITQGADIFTNDHNRLKLSVRGDNIKKSHLLFDFYKDKELAIKIVKDFGNEKHIVWIDKYLMSLNLFDNLPKKNNNPPKIKI